MSLRAWLAAVGVGVRQFMDLLYVQPVGC